MLLLLGFLTLSPIHANRVAIHSLPPVRASWQALRNDGHSYESELSEKLNQIQAMRYVMRSA